MSSKECRICLRYEENCVSLFTKRRGTKLAEIVRFCARVEIYEDDGLPGDVCSRCADEALNAYLFVNKCRRSDAELRTAQAFCRESNEDEDFGEPSYCSAAESIRPESEENKYVVPDIDPVHLLEAETKILPLPSPTAMDDIVDEAKELKTCKTQDEQPEITEVESFGEKIDVADLKSDGNEEPEVVEEFLVEYLETDFRSDALCEANVDDDHVLGFEQEELQEEINDPSTSDSCSNALIYKFICCGTRCKAVLDSYQELEEHTVQVHLAHRESDSKEKPYECTRCYARFNSEKSLTLHRRKSSHCPLCLQICFSNKDKRLHMHQVHGHSISASLVQVSMKICCGCHESFDSEEELRAHSQEQHAIRKSAVDETRPLQCDVCYKLFRTTESLRIHQRFVYRPKNFVCSMCNRAFDTRSKLISHEVVHSEQRDFQCDKCDKSFKKGIDLKSHQLLHNEKREECTVCGLRFHRKSNLKMHMRKHQDTFFYACPDCPKQFKNNSHLKEHYKVHSKQKPYSCSYCERSFAYCSDRKRHEMSHTGNYPFECHCSKKFARKTTYDKHTAVCQERAE
ncbi:zinc finger protein ZFP2-like [Topomyia yanbarensis]|uniref:zinc finger protein ZFP2-like n=1 Tax=Topomyia yanbarensis TaxID=2498891 RepID=UPI00273CB8B8|nr:zinc finger protein ZFP2-like [Topomyia yanbarensis]